MSKFKVPITWSEQGTVYIEADSKEEAIALVEDGKGFDELPDPDTDDYQIEVDEEGVEEEES